MRKTNANLVLTDGDDVAKPFDIVPKPSPAVVKKRPSLRMSTISNEAAKRLSSSPGLAILRLSQALKFGDVMTPSRSILKTDSTRSEKRTAKSVLFKDFEEDKENNAQDLISFSPVTPRRSRRFHRDN